MPPILGEVTKFLGFLLSAIGFLAAGFALGRFVLDNFKSVGWQVQIALALGFFGLLIGVIDFATSGSAGAFALGAAGAFLMSMVPGRPEGAGKSK